MPFGYREVWTYLTGLLAAAQMGKMPPLMPLISDDLGLTLFTGAVVIALIELGGALFGAPAAGCAARLGEWRTLLGGLALMALGGLGEAFAGGGALVTGARVTESLGYLSVIVSAPVLMAREARRLPASLALVVWSTFLPVGLALGSVLSGALVEPLGWRIVLAAWAAVSIMLWLAAPRERAETRGGAFAPASRPSGGALVLAAGFACFTCFQVGMLALMPEFLITEKGVSPWTAGLVVGIGGFVTISGVVVPFHIARRSGGSAPKLSLPLLLISLLVPAVLLLGAFSPLASLGFSGALFIGFNMLSGIFPALVFASIPRWAGAHGISAANGAIAQAGAAGSLLGPPAYAVFVSNMGWMAAAAFGLGISTVATVILTALETRERRT